tara:strand:- start:2356 stop:3447 length:1092 start_codon:yes stop_codon:yes gene_type:complete
MRILICSSENRTFHLKCFSDELKKIGIESKIIIDTEYIEKSLSYDLKQRIIKDQKIKNLLKEFRPDIVLLDRISKIGEIFLERKIPLVILLRGNYWEESSWAKKTSSRSILKSFSFLKNQKLADKLFSNCNLILSISDYLTNEVKKRYPDKKTITLHADGRNLSDWNMGSKNVLDKNIEKQKHDFLHPCVGLVQGLNVWGKTRELKTLINVMKQLPNVTFYLAGDGIYRDSIIPELSSCKNFVWLKNLSYPNDIKIFFSSIDIYVLLSGLEGLGQSIIEAMMLERPVIASNVGGIPEIVKNSETGFLVNLGDSDKIVLLIKKLLSESKTSKKITENAKINVEQFSWAVIAKKFSKIVNEEIIK